jgi:hypothetical protein
MEHLSFGELNRIDLVDFLASIGIDSKKRKAANYFYLSPLAGHPQDSPTFVVNRRLNRWRETTTKQSGSLSDLVVRLYNCTIGELRNILQSVLPLVSHDDTNEGPDNLPRIAVEQPHSIRSGDLERYLWERRIPLPVARLYCLEATYNSDNKHRHALAFPNDAGGIELFEGNRHYRVSPFSPTHIRQQSRTITVFRHTFDLLTYATITPAPISHTTDFLILNTSVAFSTVRNIIAPYPHKHLLLPNDAAGIAFTTLAAIAFPHCQDYRSLYAGYPTLNDWICRIGTASGPKNASIPPQISQFRAIQPGALKSLKMALPPKPC